MKLKTRDTLSRWTSVARGRESASDPHRATTAPIYQTATFSQEQADAFGEYDYSRTKNPTRSEVEAKLAEIEGARHALCFGSGMAAIASVLRLVQPGERILVGSDLYGGTQRFAHGYLPGVQVEHVSMETDAFGVPSTLEEALKETVDRGGVRLVFLETPSNPRLDVTDIRAVARACHRAGALVVVDGTAMTPWLQRPLAMAGHKDASADIVVHSATKGLSGHGDLTAGVVATNDSRLHRELFARRNAEGTALAPMESWLLLRGLKTLGVRVERAQASAQVVAAALQSLPGIQRVLYPGLEDHPGHARHLTQAKGAGILVGVLLDHEADARRLVEGTTLFQTAVSFGGVSSSISAPRWMSHASVPDGAAPRPEATFVRLSIGLECPQDLLSDLEAALYGSVTGHTKSPGLKVRID